MRYGIAALRIVVGTLFIGHGLQKLMGWFKGHGLKATGDAFESMGLHPGKAHATAAALAETAGGAMIATGLLTPLGSSLVTGSMAVAIHKVHWRNGVWITEGGFEYNLVLATCAFAISASGPGALSFDEALGIEVSGLGVAIGQLAAALIGATATVLIGARGQSIEAEAAR